MNAIRVLHCHSTFSLGGKEARAVRLMNAFGPAARHVVLSAEPGALGARAAIDPAVEVAFPGDDAPLLAGPPGIGRLRRLSRYMAGFDLVLTYNWGAMDAVAAMRLFPVRGVRLIHHEDGFNADEAARLNPARSWWRRLSLPAAEAVVVPSRQLEAIATRIWRQPPGRIHRIPNGIALGAYRASPLPGAIPGFTRGAGDFVIGTLAGLRPVKNLALLVRVLARLPEEVRLVIAGEGPERAALAAEAARLGVSGRVLFPGFLPGPHRFLGHFDLFALSSDSEQFPISLVEAMAAGLPVVSTDVGDIRDILPPEAAAMLVQPGDEDALAAAIAALMRDASLRQRLAAANARAAAAYSEIEMISRYAALYRIPVNRGAESG